MSRNGSALVVILACLIALLRWDAAAPLMLSDPSVLGPFDLAELRESPYDRARGRSIELLTLFPREGGGSHPLIIFSHGFLLRSEQYRSYGEHLASHKFVVGLPSYPTSLFNLSHVDLKDDLLFVLQHYLEASITAGHPLEGLIAAERIGASGHSLGGKLSLFAATEDHRIRASVTLDPVDGGPPFGGDPERFPSVAPEMMRRIGIPLLLIGTDLGRMASSGFPCAPEGENYQRFFEAANPPAIEVTQLDAGHTQYLDDSDCGLACSACVRGNTPSDEVRAAALAYMTAFYLGHLQGNPAALDWLDERLAAGQAAGRIEVRRK